SPGLDQWRRLLGDPVLELGLACPQAAEILQQEVEEVVLVAPGLAARMRGDQDVLEGPERRGRCQRLRSEPIESCARDASVTQGLDEGAFVDAAPARNVDEMRRSFHQTQSLGADQTFGLRRQGAGE